MLSSDLSDSELTAMVPPSIATDIPNRSPIVSLAVSAANSVEVWTHLYPAAESLRRWKTHAAPRLLHVPNPPATIVSPSMSIE